MPHGLRGSYHEWEGSQIGESEFVFSTAKLHGYSERGEAPSQGWFWLVAPRDFSGLEITDGKLYPSRNEAESAGKVALRRLQEARVIGGDGE